MGSGGSKGSGTSTTVYQAAPTTSTTNQTPQIPDELKGLATSSATGLQNIQQMAPLSDFMAPHPQQIAPLTALQNYGADLTYTLNDMPLNETLSKQYTQSAIDEASKSLAAQISPNDPLVQAQQKAFEANALPLIQNQAAKAGLGTSSSALDAIARGEAATLPGAINTALATELAQQQGLTSAYGAGATSLAGLSAADTARLQQAINTAESVGAVQQSYQQAVLNAEYQDYLRRMGLSEEATLAGTGMFPSMIGTDIVSTGTQYINPMVTSSQGTSGGGMFK